MERVTKKLFEYIARIKKTNINKRLQKRFKARSRD